MSDIKLGFGGLAQAMGDSLAKIGAVGVMAGATVNTDRLYTWGELHMHPEKKFQREDWEGTDRYLVWVDGWLLDIDSSKYSTGFSYKPTIKDGELNWREYVA